jgi:hypothetical protein
MWEKYVWEIFLPFQINQIEKIPEWPSRISLKVTWVWVNQEVVLSIKIIWKEFTIYIASELAKVIRSFFLLLLFFKQEKKK